MGSLPKNVVRGAEFLDENLPGWEKKIDLETLDLSSTCGCVLGQQLRTGQADRRYDRMRKRLGLNDRQADLLGFNLYGTQRYSNLTAAWRRLIAARQSGASTTSGSAATEKTDV